MVVFLLQVNCKYTSKSVVSAKFLTSSARGAPSGPGNAFSGPLHSRSSHSAYKLSLPTVSLKALFLNQLLNSVSADDPNRPIQHNPQNATNQLQQQQGFGPNILHHNSAPPIGGQGGGAVNFGGPLQQQPPPQDAVRLQQLSFGGPIPQAHLPGAPGLQQGGQQPILNVRPHLCANSLL
jgi:paired amphipathic helix protein Sin3a